MLYSIGVNEFKGINLRSKGVNIIQVQAINTQNNKNTSFGAIYQPKNVKFNKIQEPIANAIKQAMREPLQKFKGETAEGFYKSKGYDFGIEPYWTDSVSSVHFNARKTYS